MSTVYAYISELNVNCRTGGGLSIGIIVKKKKDIKHDYWYYQDGNTKQISPPISLKLTAHRYVLFWVSEV